MEWDNYFDKKLGLPVIDFNVILGMYNYYYTLQVTLHPVTAISNWLFYNVPITHSKIYRAFHKKAILQARTTLYRILVSCTKTHFRLPHSLE
jgi:hypothetical protein